MTDIKAFIGKKKNDPAKRSYSVIVKNCIDCNFNCTYCYTEEVQEIKAMDIKTAEVMINKVVSYAGDRSIHFVWHGGEPLMSGLDFFYGVADITQNIKNVEIENNIQTNASLVDDRFIEFCKAKNFSVSTSLDGPEDIHNANRKDKSGKGTFERTMNGVRKLQQAGISVGSVSVLHKQNVKEIDAFYNFFKENKINVRVNPVVKAGNATTNYNSLAITPKEYGEAMCKLFDLWIEDENQIKMEPFMTIIGNILDDEVWGCYYQGQCLQSIISITPEGNIYPCGRFIGDDGFKLGNILECNDLADVFQSDLYKRLSSRDATVVANCKNCDFSEICNGGCMITAHMAKGDIYDSDYYCGGRKMLFEHIVKRLKEEA